MSDRNTDIYRRDKNNIIEKKKNTDISNNSNKLKKTLDLIDQTLISLRMESASSPADKDALGAAKASLSAARTSLSAVRRASSPVPRAFSPAARASSSVSGRAWTRSVKSPAEREYSPVPRASSSAPRESSSAPRGRAYGIGLRIDNNGRVYPERRERSYR